MNPENTKWSRRALLQAASGLSAAALVGRLPEAWDAAKHHAAPATFQNPLFAGDYPDPTILRVGHDFYLTHTSYTYAPGLVIWHSRDLVNWMPVSHVLSDMQGVHAEIWSPDFVEHDGRFFIYFPMGGIYVVHAEHPAGPWSAPIDLKIDDIDPGHVAGPDGKRYLYTAGGHMTELSADGLSTVGERAKIYDGWVFPSDWKTEGFWLESPKLTKRGDYYYLICAEGGTAGPPTSHMAVVARSVSPIGPWENSPYNPLIHTYDADEAWWSVGHGTLVSTPDDRWYFVYHGYRDGFKTLGRNILLEPIEWTSDGWPRAPLGARRTDPMPAPMGVSQGPRFALSDDFMAQSLRPTWGAWNETDMSRFQVGNGTLIMRAKGDVAGQSSPLTVKAGDRSYTVQVTATPQNDCAASLGLFYDPDHWLFAEFKNGQLRVYEAQQTLASRTWRGSTVHLKIVNLNNRITFLAGEDRHAWQNLVADVDVSDFKQNPLGGFKALRPALAATGSGEARFTDFNYNAV